LSPATAEKDLEQPPFFRRVAKRAELEPELLDPSRLEHVTRRADNLPESHPMLATLDRKPV
jgi:hypothetical protein